MPTFKTPGVYVEETPSLPPKVIEINSSIPALIGYTQRTSFNEQDLLYQPTKIKSILEFVSIFGKSAPFNITGVTANLAETDAKAKVENQYFLYDSLQLYYLNGGVPCYIVSIGSYFETPTLIDFESGLNALDYFDDPTIYLFPDAVKLNADDLGKLQQLSLNKCAKLGDRFSIFDFHRNTNSSANLNSAATFREKIGISNLSYGAAYTPWLKTTLDKDLTANSIAGIFETINGLDDIILNQNIKGKTVKSHVKEYQDLLSDINSLQTNVAISAVYQKFPDEVADFSTGPYADGSRNPFENDEIFNSIIKFVPTSSYFQTFWKDEFLSTIATYKTNYTGNPTEKEKYLIALLNSPSMRRFRNLAEFVSNDLKSTLDSFEKVLFDNIPYYAALIKILKNKITILPPSGPIAGIYCKTDKEKGIWKAPANISLSAVTGVAQQFSTTDLDALNIDAVAGKSINVIRQITGRGTMAMGARTLAGNNSDWRYIPVRRLLIFIEENSRRSLAWVVFEPNNQLLWLKVKSQLENYLFELWRRGALSGSKPEQSYHVNCGLNSTMTAQDVLDGRLRIDINLAPIRPAEFIVLKIIQQLQKS
ncbi:phage tail sheath family protein [Kaistella antarctica]|uniref:Phage tail sheath protein n=1 Tax=Kaistella antarctica TaxID=266748 RepID=A0A3S4ULV8_9FLAO|nr:phage tail sheath C-terminal domain-containing protein [Kaistella antarctica]KEY19079.1 hypothetical protein HY04_11640 [Kaistella antarctica]SEW11851.1 hypothetical protein SAMN05421765_2411 [Kaistella antarctica]VEH98925.1 Phage tail sheath protein [Kaistella antarctica]